MILYGRRASHLKLKELKDYKCKACGKRGVVVSLFQKYFHILYLPMFPLSKKGASQCLHCRDVQVEKKFDDKLIEATKELKEGAKTPIWMFSGLAFFLLIYFVKLLVW